MVGWFWQRLKIHFKKCFYIFALKIPHRLILLFEVQLYSLNYINKILEIVLFSFLKTLK